MHGVTRDSNRFSEQGDVPREGWPRGCQILLKSLSARDGGMDQQGTAASGAGSLLALGIQQVATDLQAKLDAHADELCGRKHKPKTSEQRRYKRWSHDPRKIKIGGRKMPIKVPRILHVDGSGEYHPPRFAELIKSAEIVDPIAERVQCSVPLRDMDSVDIPRESAAR